MLVQWALQIQTTSQQHFSIRDILDLKYTGWLHPFFILAMNFFSCFHALLFHLCYCFLIVTDRDSPIPFRNHRKESKENLSVPLWLTALHSPITRAVTLARHQTVINQVAT